MATCDNCGSHVTDQYAKVFEPESIASNGRVRCCPNCTDMVRSMGEVRPRRF